MNKPKQLTAQADRILKGAACAPKNLVFVHTLVLVAILGVGTLLDMLLTWQMEQTAGLSGMGLRAILSTARSLASVAGGLIQPFWQMGIVYVAIRLVQSGNAERGDLKQGFRRFGPILRLLLLETVILFAVGLGSGYLSTAVFMLTPYAQGLTEQLAPYAGQSADALLQDEAIMLQVMEQMRPVLYIWAAVFLAVSIPVIYRMRMATYVLLSDDTAGAIVSLRESRRQMKGRRLQLFRLDLHFWWFYLAQALLTAVSLFGSLLIKPLPEQVAALISYGLYLLGTLLLMWQCRARVEVSYALFFLRAKKPLTQIENGKEN